MNLDKLAAALQQMNIPQVRRGRRPVRIQKLLDRDARGLLFKPLHKEASMFHKFAAARMEFTSYLQGLAAERAKTAGILPKMTAADKIRKHLQKHDHAYDLAGLGVLGAIGADRIQAHARAGLGANNHDIEKKQLLGETGHALLDTAGLGILAAPVAAHIIRRH